MFPPRILRGVPPVGEHGSGWRGGGRLPLAAALPEAHDLAQPLKRAQRGGIPGGRSRRRARIVRGTHGERGGGPIRELDEQVGSNALPAPDQEDPLAAQRVLGMGDRDGCRRGWGKGGSVL